MKRPLVSVALWYTGGILLAEYLPLQPPLIFLFAAAFACAAIALLVSRYRAVSLAALLVCSGWANMAWRTAVLSPHDLRVTQGRESRLVSLRGVLAGKPDLRVRPGTGEDGEEFARTMAVVDVTGIRDLSAGSGTQWRPAHGRVLVTTYGRLGAEFGAGTEVEVTGRLGMPPSALAEGLFDYRQYLKWQGIYYQLKVERSAEWQVVNAKGQAVSGKSEAQSAKGQEVSGKSEEAVWASPFVLTSSPFVSFSDRFLDWAQKTLARGLPEEDEPLRLLWAMTLGWKTGMTNEVYEPFMRSGTMHIFAISGLHIALIAGVLVSLLRVARVPRGGCGLVAIPLIWFYTGATGWQPSAIRSALMMTVVIGGWALKRPSNLVNSLAAAGLMILLWEPRQLFGASFQLSFFVVLSIALFVPPVQAWIERRLHADPLLPEELLPRRKRWALGTARWFVPSVATSVAAWLGSWPLTLHYFHLVSWVTLPVNLVVVPLSGFALAANLGGLLCGAWWPWATELFNHSAWFWMLCMVRLSEWACLAPAGYRYAPALCGPGLAVYYAVLIGVMSGWLLAKERRRWVLAGAAALAMVLAAHVYGRGRVATVTVLPLNGGMGIVCEDDNGRWVADPGGTNSVRYTLGQFLHARGVNTVPRLLLTHGDAKHVAGAASFADAFQVSDVLVPDVRFRSTVYKRALQGFEASSERSVRVLKLGLGDELNSAKRETVREAREQPVVRRNQWRGWQVLHPVAGARYGRADDGALVLAGMVNGTRVLVVSDLGEEGQRALLEQDCDLSADVVVSGLPSNGEPLTDDFLEAVQPKVIVIGDSELPSSERANFDLKERLKGRRAKVLYTSESGAVTVRCWKGGRFECRGKNGEAVSGKG